MSTSLTATRARPVALETTAPGSARAASSSWFSAARLFLWSLGSVRQRVLRIWWSPLYTVGMLFLLLGGAQYFGHLTLDPIRTRESVLKLVAYLLLFFVATQLVMSGGEESLVRFGF